MEGYSVGDNDFVGRYVGTFVGDVVFIGGLVGTEEAMGLLVDAFIFFDSSLSSGFFDLLLNGTPTPRPIAKSRNTTNSRSRVASAFGEQHHSFLDT